MQPSAFDINQRMTCQNSANENGSKSLDSNRFPEHDSTVCDSSRTIALIRFRYSFFLKTALGVQGWRSGESTRLPPMWPGFDSRTRRHMWVEFVGSLLCTERFSPGTPVSPLLKNQHLT